MNLPMCKAAEVAKVIPLVTGRAKEDCKTLAGQWKAAEAGNGKYPVDDSICRCFRNVQSSVANQLKCRFNPQTPDSAADYWKKCHATGRWSRRRACGRACCGTCRRDTC